MDATRQYGRTLDEITDHHIRRYRFAVEKIKEAKKPSETPTIIDAACGCGYGSKILHDAGFKVRGIDISEAAIKFAEEHYPGPTYEQADIQEVRNLRAWGVVSFETLEHIANPHRFLASLDADFLIASVPNEERYPFQAERFTWDEYPHLRHYTPLQFEALFEANGWRVTERYCQPNKLAEIVPGFDGMFLIYVADRIPYGPRDSEY